MTPLERLIKKFEGLSNERISTIIVGFSFVLVIFAFFVWQQSRNFAEIKQLKKEPVFVTVFPLSDIVQGVGGDAIEVTLLTENVSRRPMDSTVDLLNQEDVILGLGHAMDGRVAEVLAEKGIDVIDASEGAIELGFNPDLVKNQESSYSAQLLNEDDRYYWVSPVNVLLMAKHIKDLLIEAYPTSKQRIEANHNAFAKQVAKLDVELRKQLAPVVGSEIVTVGTTWRHLARDYGFKIRAEFLGPDQDPNVGGKLEALLEEGGVKTIFIDPSVDTGSLQALTDSYGISVVMLDPYGGVEGRDTYETLMQYNVDQLRNWN